MKQKLIILNRWDDEFSKYDTYIDHTKYIVSYVSNQINFRISEANKTIYVEDITDYNLVKNAVKECITDMNGVDKLIAMSEFDLEIAAKLREDLEINGVTTEQVKLYRDKVAMKKALVLTKIKYPKFTEINNYQDIVKFLTIHPLPIILKPRRGAASIGVIKISNQEELLKISNMDFNDYECEQFIHGDILHVDGAVYESKLLFCIASKYINTCLEFSDGNPLGSVMIDDFELNKRIKDISKEILDSISLLTGIFHLELILNNNELYFLEIGARCGGGEIPFILNNEFKINMFKVWVNLELNEQLQDYNLNKNKITGFLMFPKPNLDTDLIITNTQNLSKQIKQITYERRPIIGTVINKDVPNEDPVGVYHFVGSSTEVVEAAINETISKFKLS
ncbi:MAG: ATP-grasp domain-containing protein [Burkholderiales bacterium]|nr:ATP-grasp domain-containing protein [Burkholderiales bacterium]MBP9768575.1 ATP-grasp domain-containing protein [Burkholderiales bacterium]